MHRVFWSTTRLISASPKLWHLSWTLFCTSGETAAAAPSETPLLEKTSSKPEPAEPPPTPRDPQTPPADSQKVAFKLGGSEEADLDHNDVEAKDLDISNGEKWMKS